MVVDLDANENPVLIWCLGLECLGKNTDIL